MGKLKSVPRKMTFNEFIKTLDLGILKEGIARKVAAAYSDCLPENVDHENVERCLDFMSTEAVPAIDLNKFFQLIGDYNDFSPEQSAKELREVFGDDARIFIAREGSPCVYIKPLKQVWFGRRAAKINCDEFSYDADLGMFRVWWD